VLKGGCLYSHVLGVFHTTGLAAQTMGSVAIGLAALLEDGLVLEFLVMLRDHVNSDQKQEITPFDLFSSAIRII
jgi:hypothetical protein